MRHGGRTPIREHHTDTGGFSDHVFALCALLGYRFAPRICGLPEKRLYVLESSPRPPTLAPLIARAARLGQIRAAWPRIIQLAASIRSRQVSAAHSVATLRRSGVDVPDELLRNVWPLGWDHVSLPGDYRWSADNPKGLDQLRPPSPRSSQSGKSRLTGILELTDQVTLHGVIIAYAYGIPARLATFRDSDRQIQGDGMKFDDYFLSIGRMNVKALDLSQIDHLGAEIAAARIDNPAHGIDLQALLDAAPFTVAPRFWRHCASFSRKRVLVPAPP